MYIHIINNDGHKEYCESILVRGDRVLTLVNCIVR